MFISSGAMDLLMRCKDDFTVFTVERIDRYVSSGRGYYARPRYTTKYESSIWILCCWLPLIVTMTVQDLSSTLRDAERPLFPQ